MSLALLPKDELYPDNEPVVTLSDVSWRGSALSDDLIPNELGGEHSVVRCSHEVFQHYVFTVPTSSISTIQAVQRWNIVPLNGERITVRECYLSFRDSLGCRVDYTHHLAVRFGVKKHEDQFSERGFDSTSRTLPHDSQPAHTDKGNYIVGYYNPRCVHYLIVLPQLCLRLLKKRKCRLALLIRLRQY